MTLQPYQRLLVYLRARGGERSPEVPALGAQPALGPELGGLCTYRAEEVAGHTGAPDISHPVSTDSLSTGPKHGVEQVHSE